MKISVVTIVRNAVATVGDALASVARQDHSDVEHVVVDGASTDGTLEVVRRFGHVARLVSEPDRGLYDALNKGIRLATGEVVGLLHADDFYPHAGVLSRVAAELAEPAIDAVYADVRFVDRRELARVVRYYSSARFRPELFAWGYMPAHPTFFVRKSFHDRLGDYKIDYKIAADYELLIRFLWTHRLRTRYVPEALVTMRTGGASNRNWRARLLLNQEIVRACRENGISTNLAKLTFKYFRKVWEYAAPAGR